MSLESGDLHFKLSRFLFRCRKSPNTTPGTSPAELMFGRQIWRQLDLLKRDLSSDLNKEETQDFLKGMMRYNT